MDTTVMALQNLYVALGGELTDTYEGIADGAPVSDMVIIPDVINAIAQKVTTTTAADNSDSGDDSGDDSGNDTGNNEGGN